MRRGVLLAVLALALASPGRAARDAIGLRLADARAALERGDGVTAEIALGKAMQAGATRQQVAAAMGEALIVEGQPDRAREWLAPGRFAPGEEAYGWRMLALLERRQGNLSAAGRALDAALARNPADPMVWVEIGRLRYSGGEHLQAIEAANKALALDPENPRALELNAQLQRESAGYADALQLYREALVQAPEDLDLLMGEAATLGEMGEAEAMLRTTRKMIDLDPHDRRAWYLEAVLAARAGDMALARRLINRGRLEGDARPGARLLVAIAELEAGNANRAAILLEPLADQNGANRRIQLLLARAYAEAGLYPQLFARFLASAQRADASPYLLTLIGRAYEDLGDRAAAAPWLDRAANPPPPALMPIPPQGVVQPADLVRAPLAAGDFAAARVLAETFLKAHPGSADALGLAGDVALASGDGRTALALYAQASRVRFPDLLLLRTARAFDQVGTQQAGGLLAARYLDSFPASRLAARLAADQAAQSGDWPRAVLLLDNLRLRGGGRDHRLLADLAFAQIKLGRGEAALAIAERAHALQPASATAAQVRAMALIALHRDPALARQLLDQARAIGGDNPLLTEYRRKLGAE